MVTFRQPLKRCLLSVSSGSLKRGLEPAVFILHQSMDGPWPGPEPGPGSGQGKAAALESLDGIKIHRPRKKSEALSRRTTQSHPSSRRPSLAHLGPRSLTGLWTLAGELGRSLHSGLARANPEPEKIRGKEWCSVTSVYSVKEGVTGSRPGPGGGCLGASSKAGRGGGVTQDVGGGPLRVQPSPESHSPRKEARKGCVSRWRKHSQIAHYS